VIVGANRARQSKIPLSIAYLNEFLTTPAPGPGGGRGVAQPRAAKGRAVPAFGTVTLTVTVTIAPDDIAMLHEVTATDHDDKCCNLSTTSTVTVTSTVTMPQPSR
jgi:hypothetical protein